MSELLDEYQTAKSKLEHYKKLENRLRLQVIDKHFPNVSGEGTQTAREGQLKIKATFRMNYKLDRKILTDVKDFLTEEEENCIDYKPTLSLTHYRGLEESERVSLDECITVTPGLPSLSIEIDEDAIFEDWDEGHEG